MATDATFQRARRPEQKQQRQDAILGAARQLALRDGVRNVSLTDIAEKVGIHKSALLRYSAERQRYYWPAWFGAGPTPRTGTPESRVRRRRQGGPALTAGSACPRQ